MSDSKTNKKSVHKQEKATATPQKTQAEFIRMNVNIPKPFYKKIKQLALDHDTTVTDIVIKALERHMNDF